MSFNVRSNLNITENFVHLLKSGFFPEIFLRFFLGEKKGLWRGLFYSFNIAIQKLPTIFKHREIVNDFCSVCAVTDRKEILMAFVYSFWD